jgi:hypothetical protein
MAIYTYIDKDGYPREVETEHSNLVHRRIAYKEIYLKNKEDYALPFSEYVVHHIDGRKKNNDVENLMVLTPKQHRKIHGIDENEPVIKSEPKPKPPKKPTKSNVHKMEKTDLEYFHKFIGFLNIIYFLLLALLTMDWYTSMNVGILTQLNNYLTTNYDGIGRLFAWLIIILPVIYYKTRKKK